MTEIKLNGVVIQRSRNLRCIISRAHKVGVHKATVHKCAPFLAPSYGGQVYIEFADGSEARTMFTDFSVARDWLRSRWKRWGLHAEVRNSDDY